ncbi:MAG: SRPBCC family protein [Alphaproteobacteria bacterium]|jgi:carbon monoxide dehydrogenase subunit G
MVSLSEETLIPAPLDKVWPLLRDPQVVADCIPGAELAPNTDDKVWRGSIRVKFGPTVVMFRGEAGLEFDEETKTCTVQGRGIDQRGASRALASGRMALTGDQTCTLAINGEFNVTGPLEAFANAGGVHVARALLADFATNLAARVADQADPDAVTPPNENTGGDTPAEQATPQPQLETAPQPAPKAANELNAFSFAWKVLKSMLAALVSRKGR